MSASPFDLSGRTAVVTGAFPGIGLGMADALAAAGADVIAVASRPCPRAAPFEQAVTAHGRRFTARHADFSDVDAVVALGEELSGLDIDILVNNAGTIERAAAAEHPLDAWRRVIDVDLTSHFALTQKLAGPMLDRGDGRVIFTASLLSFQAASPSRVRGREVGHRRPHARAEQRVGRSRGHRERHRAGLHHRHDNTQALQDDPDRSRSILERIPAGRWGRADDLGGATVFLASAAAAYVSGIVLPVDGGWLAR